MVLIHNGVEMENNWWLGDYLIRNDETIHLVVRMRAAAKEFMKYTTAKMRGVESQAMVMCASSPDKVEIMEVDPSCIPGDVVEYGTFIRRPDAVLNPKKKIWEAVAVDLKVSQEGVAVYKDQVLTIKQKQITAPTLKNVPMK